MNKQRGRPRGGSAGGRERILAAAGPLFLSEGYQGTTLRTVADRAGCDAALISYHFGSKKGLFAEAMALEVAPSAVLDAALPGDPAALGLRLMPRVVAFWERPELTHALADLVRLALADEGVRNTFVEYIDKELQDRLVEYFGGIDGRTRATALLTLVIGTIFGRYVLQIPGLASQDARLFLQALRPVAQAASAPRRAR